MVPIQREAASRPYRPCYRVIIIIRILGAEAILVHGGSVANVIDVAKMDSEVRFKFRHLSGDSGGLICSGAPISRKAESNIFCPILVQQVINCVLSGGGVRRKYVFLLKQVSKIVSNPFPER